MMCEPCFTSGLGRLADQRGAPGRLSAQPRTTGPTSLRLPVTCLDVSCHLSVLSELSFLSSCPSSELVSAVPAEHPPPPAPSLRLGWPRCARGPAPPSHVPTCRPMSQPPCVWKPNGSGWSWAGGGSQTASGGVFFRHRHSGVFGQVYLSPRQRRTSSPRPGTAGLRTPAPFLDRLHSLTRGHSAGGPWSLCLGSTFRWTPHRAASSPGRHAVSPETNRGLLSRAVSLDSVCAGLRCTSVPFSRVSSARLRLEHPLVLVVCRTCRSRCARSVTAQCQ